MPIAKQGSRLFVCLFACLLACLLACYLICLVCLVRLGWVCLGCLVGLFCFVLFTSLPTTYLGSDWIDPLLYHLKSAQCVKFFGWNIHQRVGSDALHVFGKSWIKTWSSGPRTPLHVHDLHVFASVVCGINMYFILPLPLYFSYYNIILSYYVF